LENNYYVYLHSGLSNGTVFYVGKGTKSRCYSRSSRSKAWVEFSEMSGGFVTSIYKDNMSEDEALLLENELIENPDVSWRLVNKFKNSKLDYCDVNWESFLVYDGNSPSGLSSLNNRKPVGHRKFYKNGQPQEWTIRFKDKGYRAHIIVCILNGITPAEGQVVNHKDNNPHNNQVSNLEVCNKSANSTLTHKFNSALADHDSMFGISREHHVKDDRKLNKTYHTLYFKVRLTLGGKRVSKRFSIDALGHSLALQLAKEYRDYLLRTKLANLETFSLPQQ